MKTYTFPAGYIKESFSYQVYADNQKLDICSARVSAVPINQVWPGYQRPLDQTEVTGYVMLASDKEVSFEIVSEAPIEKPVIRPLRHNIAAHCDGNKLRFILPGPGQYVIEMPNKHNMLTVFVDPEEEKLPEKNQPGVLYYGPGIHKEEKPINLKSHETLWIDEGAVLFGAVCADGQEDIHIVGRGILDNSLFERGDGHPIAFNKCSNVSVEGITIVDSSAWTMHISGCINVNIDRIKMIGMWRYNSDGCDLTNSSGCIIRNSFLRNYDDCIVIKGLGSNGDLPAENILAENCVLWCDWGKPLEIGAETSAPYIRNITFRNCDILRGGFNMMNIEHGDRAEITDILYENIYCEYAEEDEPPVFQTRPDQVYETDVHDFMPPLFAVEIAPNAYSFDKTTGNISNVTFSNINIFTEDDRIPYSRFCVEASGTGISNVTIKNVLHNGKSIVLSPDVSGNVTDLHL